MANIDCNKLYHNEIQHFPTSLKNKLTLAIISASSNDACNKYINTKIKLCNLLNIKTLVYSFDLNVSNDEIIALINKLNDDKKINGIIVELPIYDHLNKNLILNSINQYKDIDCLSDNNKYLLYSNQERFVPCTVAAIEKILNYYKISCYDKNIVIINRSDLIGKPLLFRLINSNGSLTVCHSKTKNLNLYLEKADIIITAVGKKNLIDSDMIKKDSIIIDAGIEYVDNKPYGDVDYYDVINKAKYVTKVPGGVGPITNACMINNLIKAYKLQKGDDINEKNY